MSDDARQLALFTAAQSRAIDARISEEHALSGFELMQRAAAAAWDCLRRHWPAARRLTVLCGPGNNGADGFLLARIAGQAGLAVTVIALGDSAAGDATRARGSWNGPIIRAAHGLQLAASDLLVDALFGTGLSRDMKDVAATLIAGINAHDAPVFSLDVPSGICSDSGRVRGCAVRAYVTLAFIVWKRGIFTGAALDHGGIAELGLLDLPSDWIEWGAGDAALLAWPEVLEQLPPRPNDSHKGLFGNVLAIGGDHGMGGAIALAAHSALRSGAGLVQVATRAAHVGALLTARPELMVRGVEGPQDLHASLERATVIALGPGLGTAAWGHALWHAALDSGRRTVLDADALTLLARHPRSLPAQAVLTPHPAEAARLLGTDTAQIQRDRYAAVRELASRYAAVVVLKGAGSLIASPSGQVRVCRWGNPGMATAGMGDVLTGVVAALLAQGLDAWPAACLAVAIHARAGDAAAAERGPRGLLASDVLPAVQALLNGRVP
ncbi:MAG: NAD(P)H-hydrate dehydratase [Tahibacter sp.]